MLHLADLDLIRTGVVDLDDLVTLRAGEPVLDQPRGVVARLGLEAVKVRDAETTDACRFYRDEDKSCAIYDTRPAECRALLCTDTKALEDMYERDRIGRTDILPPGHPLLELVAEQEARCPAERAVDLAEAVLRAGPDERRGLAAELAPLSAWDREIRAALGSRLPEGCQSLARAEHFLLGRPLAVVLSPLGLVLDQEAGTLGLRTGPSNQGANHEG